MPRSLGAAPLLVLLVLVACSSRELASPYRGVDIEPISESKYSLHEATPYAELVHSAKDSQPSSSPLPAQPTVETVATLATPLGRDPEPTLPSSASETVEPTRSFEARQVIGYSFESRPITAYHFGHGPQTVIFVGGMHGGYEWNTIMLAYQAIDYFLANPNAVPAQVNLIIIPSANPDGLFNVTGQEGRFEIGDLASDTTPGRFNGRGVDLNRNWDCSWSPSAFWRDRSVSGGANPFSEPESQALRDYFLEQQPSSVIFWHSSADGVYGAGCGELFQPTRELAEVYGMASGYPIADQFTHYEISGDAGDWLAIQGIPSITVELASHDLIEWPENLAGMLAVIEFYDRPGREILNPE